MLGAQALPAEVANVDYPNHHAPAEGKHMTMLHRAAGSIST